MGYTKNPFYWLKLETRYALIRSILNVENRVKVNQNKMFLAEIMFGKVSGQDAINDAFTWEKNNKCFVKLI
jgi:hypothetical protein